VNISFDLLDRAAPAPIEIVQQPVPAPVQRTAQKAEPAAAVVRNIEIEAMASKPFDELAKQHEFQLRTSVPDANYAGKKPPFEVIRLENFDFDTGSAVIRDEYIPLLNRLHAYISTGPGILKLRIEGHTDSVGSGEKNRKLSQARADAVFKSLAEKGKLSMDVEPRGYGAERLIADNSNFQGRKQNRRVEIRILRRVHLIEDEPAARI
jgi:outer membrane protein OmpA-like peptidoglycan-associated protein